MTTNLKVLISVVGLAVLATSPVLAASHVRHTAAATATTARSTTVFAPNGQKIGADPDAQIRMEMRRDWGTGVGANGE
jgi:hypothetical protein